MSKCYSLFPSPAFPDYLNPPKSLNDLIPAARNALSRVAGRGALGSVKSGEKVLIVIPPAPIQDTLVLEAIKIAFREKGIPVESISESEIGISPPIEEINYMSAEDGWKELFWRDEITAMMPPEFQIQRPKNIINEENRREIYPFIKKHPEYSSIFIGTDSRTYWRLAFGEDARRFTCNWIYLNHEDLLSKWSNFPSELVNLIEQKTVSLISQIQEARVTDPQGTDIWWEVNEEEAKLWSKGAFLSGHLEMYPPSSIENFTTPDKSIDSLVLPKAQGVIAGTSNHFGFYPHMKAFFEDGIITRIDGGGKFGELLRLIMAKTKHVHYPLHPKPGYFYLHECALGTNPKGFRNRVSLFDPYNTWFPNLRERSRSGIIHWGIGVHVSTPEVIQFGKERNLPFEHGWHFHNFFATYSVRLRKSGEWVKLIDKGRLTALDDPEVRKLASKYGNPDDLLGEDWIPAMPGINYPGDYMRDYGMDPVTWIKKEHENRLPETIGVLD